MHLEGILAVHSIVHSVGARKGGGLRSGSASRSMAATMAGGKGLHTCGEKGSSRLPPLDRDPLAT
eukprot:5388613-Prymnesium_polylepis.1